MVLSETMRAKLVRIVCFLLAPSYISFLTSSHVTGGALGHRKYECPEKRNYTASIICRVCGNAGHMARDCRDRAKGVDWRNHDPPTATGDAVDAEYDVCQLSAADFVDLFGY